MVGLVSFHPHVGPVFRPQGIREAQRNWGDREILLPSPSSCLLLPPDTSSPAFPLKALPGSLAQEDLLASWSSFCQESGEGMDPKIWAHSWRHLG